MTAARTTALVSGASAGLGAEFCRQLAARCDVIIATGRRADRLESLARELSGQAEVHVLAADLATREGRTRVIEALRQKGPVDYLVNNAGFSTLGPFHRADIDAEQAMVDVHITATMALTRAALPFMQERGGGAIINVSSLASFGPVPMASVYCASKAFLNLFSESLQREVSDSGIRVQSLCPGYTHTEFHDRDPMSGFDKAMVPEGEWMDAAEVVAASLAALESGPVVFVPGDANRENARSRLLRAADQLA